MKKTISKHWPFTDPKIYPEKAGAGRPWLYQQFAYTLPNLPPVILPPVLPVLAPPRRS